MPIATFGSKVFEVSGNKIYTFDNYSRSAALDVESQDSENNKASTYIKGYSLDKISFDIILKAGLVDVEKEITDWVSILNKKNPEYFILGSKFVGQNKFLLISLEQSDSIITNQGKILKTKLSISLQEYVRAGYKQEKEKKSKVDYEQIVNNAKVRDNSEAINSILGSLVGTKPKKDNMPAVKSMIDDILKAKK